MKHFGKIISISAMNERSFTTQQGDQRVTAEIGVVVSDGIDCGNFELSDDNARNFAKEVATGSFKPGDTVTVDFFITDSVSKNADGSEKGHFTHLRARRIVRLFKA